MASWALLLQAKAMATLFAAWVLVTLIQALVAGAELTSPVLRLV